MSKTKVLFLCTGNSCCSQMAEGWARHLPGDTIDAYSAGIEAHGMNPNAVKVMDEAGVDISGQSSKLASTLEDVPLDVVITVCGHADENCPAFLGKARVVHVGYDPCHRSHLRHHRAAVGWTAATIYGWFTH